MVDDQYLNACFEAWILTLLDNCTDIFRQGMKYLHQENSAHPVLTGAGNCVIWVFEFSCQSFLPRMSLVTQCLYNFSSCTFTDQEAFTSHAKSKYSKYVTRKPTFDLTMVGCKTLKAFVDTINKGLPKIINPITECVCRSSHCTTISWKSKNAVFRALDF